MMISFGLLLTGVTLTATATTPVTRSQMESFVYVVVAGAGACLVAAFWVLMLTITGRTERAVERIVAALEAHHEDPLAHPAGSANRINPVMERLDLIEQRLEKTHDVLVELHAEHRVIRATEDEVCTLIRARADARRKTDPDGFDPA